MKESQIDKYISYLKTCIGWKLEIPRDLQPSLRSIRELRNYYAHNNFDSKKFIRLKEELHSVSPALVIDEQIELNVDYMIAVFKSVGEMSKIIGEAYCDYHNR